MSNSTDDAERIASVFRLADKLVRETEYLELSKEQRFVLAGAITGFVFGCEERFHPRHDRRTWKELLDKFFSSKRRERGAS